MTDLHTHILPNIDDGARNADESLAMLAMQKSLGVDTVVLTPHFRRSREEAQHFLQRREEAFSELRAAMARSGGEYPRLLLGAEVEWVPNLTDCELLPRLCLGESKYLLLELPRYAWSDSLIEQLYHLQQKTGITPILAHIERYLRIQKRDRLRDIFELGVPIQMSAEMLLQHSTRHTALSLLRKGCVSLLASDCHGAERRQPNLPTALAVISRKFGGDFSSHGDEYIRNT